MHDQTYCLQKAHAALAQFYRWYQVYEAPFTTQRIENQKDILSPHVEISSVAGTTKGKEHLEERLKVYEGWQNAHHVQQTAVEILDDGHLSLEADIVYQNIRPDQSQFIYTIHYSTELELRENDLPLFTNIEIQPTGALETFVFEDAYPKNRCKSLMHYYLHLLENPVGQNARFREIFAEDFSFDLGTGEVIDNWEQMDNWLNTMPERVAISIHHPKKFKVTERGDGSFLVSVNFEWEGINSKGENIASESHHEWLVENDMDERFARIKSIKVTRI